MPPTRAQTLQAAAIRPAAHGDLQAINDIYNHYVKHSTCTYQTDPESPDARRMWFERHGSKHPVIVAERDGHIVGWASLSPFHPRQAYARTVENSVYVLDSARRSGVGSALLAHLIDLARAAGHHAIIAGIDAEQAPSIALHERHGFEKVGHLKEVGHKFGRWLDVVYMQLRL